MIIYIVSCLEEAGEKMKMIKQGLFHIHEAALVALAMWGIETFYTFFVISAVVGHVKRRSWQGGKGLLATSKRANRYGLGRKHTCGDM